MNHPTILRIIENEIIPTAIKTGSSLEDVILKKASDNNWSPAQAERVAEVVNRVSSLSYPEQNPDDPGGKFPTINAKELGQKYASLHPSAGVEQVTVIDSPDIGRSFASYADLQGDNTIREYTIRRASEKTASQQSSEPEIPVLTEVGEKAAFTQTKKLLRDVCNEAGAQLELIEHEVYPYADKLASEFPQLEADMELYPADGVLTAVEDIKLACRHLKDVVVELGYTVSEVPCKRASSRYLDTTGFAPLVLRTVDHLKSAYRSFSTATDLVRTLNTEVFGAKLASMIEKSAFTKAAEKEKERPSDNQEEEEQKDYSWSPYIESRHLMSRSGQLGDSLYQVLGESLSPLESYTTGLMTGNRGAPVSQSVRQNLDLFRDVLGTDEYIDRKARREAEARHDVDSVTTLLGLQTGDPVLSKRDPQRVTDIYNALRQYNPELMENPETARAILQDTTAYDKVTPMHMEELLKLRKLQGEIARQQAEASDRLRRKPQKSQ